MVELAEEGLSITLRENKGKVPFEINFRASAVENNAASCFFLFPDSAIRVTDAAVVERLNWTLSSEIASVRKWSYLTAEETLLWTVLTRAPHLKVILCRIVGAKIA